MSSQTLRYSVPLAAAILMLSPGLFSSEAAIERRNLPTEYVVKAAFIYNFAQFTEWPAESFPRRDAPIVIGIFGQDPFGDVIDRMVADKKVRDRPFVVRRLGLEPTLRECHILFVSSSESQRIQTLIDYIKSSAVLTVGESDGFATNGGIVNLVLSNNKVGMEVNVAAAKHARLNISSKLLSLAKIVP